MRANVYTIAAGLPYAETLARGLIAKLGRQDNPLALADAVIYLPTRRAVRTLGDTFARLLGGAALLPQLQPLGDIEEEELLFDTADANLDLRPAISSIRRRLLLAALVSRWDRQRRGGRLDFAQAAAFARALAHFLDEAGTQEADLADLESLAPPELAEHWAEVRDFLILLRDVWPTILEAEQALEPAARRRLLLDARAKRYEASPPKGPVIAAGTTGSIPATARLLAAIARLPHGAVILPGLDRELDDESWDKLDPGHPQFGLKELLGRIGIERQDVHDWKDPPPTTAARARLLRETLRPAPTTDAWRGIAESGSDVIAQGLEGLSVIEAAHPAQEAVAIALILREALEMQGRTAALVTPDRNLARRVAAELRRWNIAIDDSAGSPLAHTPPGTFLLLLTEAVSADFAPVALLALLKHPFAAGGLERAEFRRLARMLDRECLRGARSDPGLAGVRKAVSRAPKNVAAALSHWLDGIEVRLAPLVNVFANPQVEIAVIAQAHARAAEALAGSAGGANPVWRGEAGASAAELMAALQDEARDIPPIAPRSYLPLLRSLAEERAVRPVHGRHPRLAILGPLEARLQSFDVVVLGGLNEGTWPAATSADPWLSRPMRAALGLVAPERATGLAAHDFAMLASSPCTFFTRSTKSEGTPTVESRWLQRLRQLTSGLGLAQKLESSTPYAGLAAKLEQPDDYTPEDRPAPAPPVVKRPRSLSVTEIETWLRDPYAIYAKHVLKLEPLEPLDAEVGPLERGIAVHRILELFLKEASKNASLLSASRLIAIADQIFREFEFPHAAIALWRPRFAKAARWFVPLERERRKLIAESYLEIRGARRFEGPAGAFELRARADRIDVLKEGGATIIDYKTGAPPSQKRVKELVSPQLPLEALILAGGGFAEIGALSARELLYIQLGGGVDGGKLIGIRGVDALVSEAGQKLGERISAFDREETPYMPAVMPFRTDIAGDYDHLSRVREWSVSGWLDEEA